MIKKKISAVANQLRLGFNFACRRLGIPGFTIHQIRLPDSELVYIPIPKNACSSVKHSLFEIEFDEEFDYDYHDKWGYRDIHDYYKKRPYSFTSTDALKADDIFTTFAVVRDPVKRLISCYRNRVVDLQDLKKSAFLLNQMGLPVQPDLNEFVLNLERYREANKIIEHHSRSQHKFLDGSLNYIDEVFPMEEIESLEQMLREINPNLKLRMEKSGGTSFGIEDLSVEALEHAIDFYRIDYDLLADYYDPDEIRAEYQQV